MKRFFRGSNGRSEISITEGPMFLNILFYTIPTIFSGVLQLLYNLADNIVIGQFSSNENSLAAVGSTGALTNLIVNLLFGLSVGTGVLVARAYGARDEKALSDAVHTSVTVSAIGGVLFAVLGIIFSRPLLILMGTRPEVLDSAALYMKIYFAGMPANAVFNFCASILRSVGDTKRPMLILSATGIVNVVCNLIFVIVFNMDVAGVALATIIAQYLSAAVIVAILLKTKASYKLSLRKLCVKATVFGGLLKIGLPSGIQGCFFSLSNVIIQSAVNTFPTVYVNGNTVSSTIEGFVYIAMNSFYHTALTFVGQNLGAGKYDRIKKSAILIPLQVSLVGIILGFTLLYFGTPLALFIKNSEEIAAASLFRMRVILPTYFLCGIMDVLVGVLRGLGYSTISMLAALFGSCILRIAWVKFVFPIYGSLTGLFISYPISWALTDLILVATLLFLAFPKTKKRINLSRDITNLS